MNVIHRFISSEAADYPVSEICRMLGVSRSGYYGWAARPEPADDFAPRVEEAFWRHSRRYGSRRVTIEVQAELTAEGKGEWIGHRRVQRLMRKLELCAIQPRRFVPRTTDSRHGQQMSPNLLLEREIKADRPRQVLVSDIPIYPYRTGNGHI
ncbi:MAG: transposase [Blastocatellia bacterium]|nr:transposase [Blastocatellia bacterium]